MSVISDTVRSIALVSAYPVNLNTGMLTVEYAFPELRDGQFKIDRFCIEREFSVKSPGLKKMNYEVLDSERRLHDYDRIVFWGDFLHWRGYLLNDIRQRVDTKSSFETIRKRYLECILLGRSKDLQDKAVLFGGTIYPISASDMSDTVYRQALVSLIRNARYVRFRDSHSTGVATRLSSRSIRLGIDPAFLLDTESIGAIKHDYPYVCCSFGRSGFDKELLALAINYAKKKKLKLFNLRWLRCAGPQNDIAKKIALIKGASAVITDIYHCAINSLREGIPVVLFGKGLDTTLKTVGDKKKEILFRDEIISPAYIYCEKLDASGPGMSENQINMIEDALGAYSDMYFLGLNKRIHLERKMLIKSMLD